MTRKEMFQIIRDAQTLKAMGFSREAVQRMIARDLKRHPWPGTNARIIVQQVFDGRPKAITLSIIGA